MSLLLTQEQKAHTKLENYVKNYKVFMDTCSILQTDNLFWEHIYPLLNKYKKNIIIPQKCIEELNKLKLSSEAKLSENAKKKILLLEELRTKKIIEIRGEKNDNFADNVFQSVFTKFRLQHNLLLITQDKKLAKDILRLNEIESQKSQYKIVVNQINKYGYLSNTIFTGKIEQNNPQKKINKNTKLNSDSIFEICTKVTTLPDDTIPVSYVPSENMPVYTENGNIQLKNKIAQGGEGILFETNTPFVAKFTSKKEIHGDGLKKLNLC
ncbi:MAG: PIN domain-containing protein [Treponema sp.]